MRVREKKHRLPEAAYRGRKGVAFTACTKNRRPGLADPQVVEAFLPLMTTSWDEHGCGIPLYCFMPDHLHIVVRGQNDESAPKRAMEAFKRSSGMWLAQHLPSVEWQGNFHDRILRTKESAAMLRYIALNPVRAGYAEDINAWPFTGSIGYDSAEVFLDAFWD